jgi:hypothetical protein
MVVAPIRRTMDTEVDAELDRLLRELLLSIPDIVDRDTLPSVIVEEQTEPMSRAARGSDPPPLASEASVEPPAE